MCVCLFCSNLHSQTNRVLVSVDWPNQSYENKVEIYDPANNLLLTICNPDECYQSSGSSDQYLATYDLGCLPISPNVSPNYSIVIFNADNQSWSGSASVTVNVGGVDVLTDNGNNASTSGDVIDFLVNSSNVCNLQDSDGDSIIDLIDQDDDNDGILDINEGLGINNFDCSIPTLAFSNPVLEIGDGDSVGSIFRFSNAVTGFDILAEIIAIDPNVTLVDLDIDNAGVEDFLETRLRISGSGTKGITIQYSLVDTGTNTPASISFRIGGTAWDIDGSILILLPMVQITQQP